MARPIIDCAPERIDAVEFSLTLMQGTRLTDGETRTFPLLFHCRLFRFQMFVFAPIQGPMDDVVVSSLRIDGKEMFVRSEVGEGPFPIYRIHRDSSLRLPTMVHGLQNDVTLRNDGVSPVFFRLSCMGKGC